MADIQTPAGSVPLIPIVLFGVGGYLAWFGVHYFRDTQTIWPSTPIKDVLTGKSLPTPSPDTSTATLDAAVKKANAGLAAGVTVTPGATSTGSAIANDALQYVGAGYVFGGNADKVGNWDCSSFVSYVLGHDLHMALPGGGKWGDPGFPPNAHGPTTLNYLMFGSPINLSQVQAGDLIVSSVHMGIAISPTQFVSAQDPQLGVGVAGFPAGFPAGPPVYRRVSGTAGTGGISPTPSGNTTAPIGTG